MYRVVWYMVNILGHRLLRMHTRLPFFCNSTSRFSMQGLHNGKTQSSQRTHSMHVRRRRGVKTEGNYATPAQRRQRRNSPQITTQITVLFSNQGVGVVSAKCLRLLASLSPHLCVCVRRRMHTLETHYTQIRNTLANWLCFLASLSPHPPPLITTFTVCVSICV
jgi:hypothetical protein